MVGYEGRNMNLKSRHKKLLFALCVIVALAVFFFGAVGGCTPYLSILSPFLPSNYLRGVAEGAERAIEEPSPDHFTVDDFLYYYDKLGSPLLVLLFVFVRWVVLPVKKACEVAKTGLNNFERTMMESRDALIKLSTLVTAIDKRQEERL